MLFVHARTNSVVVRFHATLLALIITAGLAFVTTNPGRGEESPAYAIEVSDVTAKVGERAVMQVKLLAFRDGYRILQSYNNRVIKLSAEDSGVASECGPAFLLCRIFLPETGDHFSKTCFSSPISPLRPAG